MNALTWPQNDAEDPEYDRDRDIRFPRFCSHCDKPIEREIEADRVKYTRATGESWFDYVHKRNCEPARDCRTPELKF